MSLLIVFSQADWRRERNKINISFNLYSPHMLIVPPDLEYCLACNQQSRSVISADSFVLCSSSFPVVFPLPGFFPLLPSMSYCSSQHLSVLSFTACPLSPWSHGDEMQLRGDLLDILHLAKPRTRRGTQPHKSQKKEFDIIIQM